MKALTVKNPWAWSIINAGKDVENRSKPTNYRGQLYIHAAKTLADDEAFRFPLYDEAFATALAVVRHTIDKVGYVLGNPSTAIRNPSARLGRTATPTTGNFGLWNLAETS